MAMLKDKLHETVDALLGKSVDAMSAEDAQAFAEGAARLLEGAAFVFPVEGASEPPVLSDAARRVLTCLLDGSDIAHTGLTVAAIELALAELRALA